MQQRRIFAVGWKINDDYNELKKYLKVEIMDIKTTISEALKELVVPKLREIRQLIQEMTSVQQMNNRRIDDMIGHSWDTSRKIDEVNNELDLLRHGFHEVRIELNERIDSLNHSLSTRIDVTNERIDRLYDDVVRREEHEELKKHLHAFNRGLKRLEEKVGVV